MAAKKDMVDFGADMDIEELIADGQAKHQQLREEADMQANEIIKQSTSQEGLNMSVEKIDMFKFQDQDFTNARNDFQKRLAEKIQTKILEQTKD